VASTRGSRGARVLLSAAALVALWQVGSRLYASYILPGPATVWRSFTDTLSRGAWTANVGATLLHMFVAVAVILLAGLPIGILIGRSVIAEDLSRVWLVFLQTVPTIVLIAIALIFIGASTQAVVAVTVASGLSYFLLNVIQGTRAIDRDLIDMAKAYGASETVITRAILLPSVVPYFLAGSRITLGVAWQVTLFAEYLMGSNGVGFQVSTSIKLLDTATVFMWGLSIVILTLLLEYGAFRPLEAYLTRHTRRAA
jgi:NitT/TauT family transport system permease protein